jgi:hypothetical protein
MNDSPKINEQFQSRHIDGKSDIDWVKLQEIEKDICLLYHQLASYSFIMDDLYFGSVFNLPYWNFLDIQELEDEKRRFIREGSLVFIYAIILGEAGGSSTFLSCEKERCKQCKEKIDSCVSENSDERLILESIKHCFELIEKNEIGDTSIFSNSTEIHKRFVRRYFDTISNEFKKNEYFKD